MEKWPGIAPNRAGRTFFLLIQTLPTFWAEQIWILRNLTFCFFLHPTFLDFQVPRSQKSQISRFPDFQTPPTTTEELSDPNLTPLPTHPGIKYVARALAATWHDEELTCREQVDEGYFFDVGHRLT